MVASKEMCVIGLLDKIVRRFESWNYFIVWNFDLNLIRRISSYYNYVNHFQDFKPTWATNIIGVRYIWTRVGCPTPPQEATELGKTVST